MKTSEFKAKLAEILPEGTALSDEVLENVAGGLDLDATGEELINALARFGINISPEGLKHTVSADVISRGGLAISKPSPGGLYG